jgi:hypothetical protein
MQPDGDGAEDGAKAPGVSVRVGLWVWNLPPRVRALTIGSAAFLLLAAGLFYAYWTTGGAERHAYDASPVCSRAARGGCRYHERATVMTVRHGQAGAQVLLRRSDGAPLGFADVLHRSGEPAGLRPGSTVTVEWWRERLVRLRGGNGVKADTAANPDDASSALLVAAVIAGALAVLCGLGTVIARAQSRPVRR